MKRRRTMVDISKFSQQELCEADDVLNSWGWYEGFGEKPEGFDDMPDYRRTLKEKIFHVPAKEDYIFPYCAAMNRIVPEKELLRYHHIHNLGRTNEEFEKWWSKERLGFPKDRWNVWDCHSRIYEILSWVTMLLALLMVIMGIAVVIKIAKG